MATEKSFYNYLDELKSEGHSAHKIHKVFHAWYVNNLGVHTDSGCDPACKDHQRCDGNTCVDDIGGES
jgi:hypothetical protein